MLWLRQINNNKGGCWSTLLPSPASARGPWLRVSRKGTSTYIIVKYVALETTTTTTGRPPTHNKSCHPSCSLRTLLRVLCSARRSCIVVFLEAGVTEEVADGENKHLNAATSTVVMHRTQISQIPELLKYHIGLMSIWCQMAPYRHWRMPIWYQLTSYRHLRIRGCRNSRYLCTMNNSTGNDQWKVADCASLSKRSEVSSRVYYPRFHNMLIWIFFN